MDKKSRNSRIGLFGGVGYEATLLYYKEIHKRLLPVYEQLGQPEVVIVSPDHKKLIDLLAEKKIEELNICSLDVVQLLEGAGCTFGAICCNTAHLFYEYVSKRCPLPMISIIEEVFNYVDKSGFKKPLILGSFETMTNRTYPDVFDSRGDEKGIKLVHLEDRKEIEYIHDAIFKELEFGIHKEETKKHIEGLILECHKEKGIDSVIMGCTELPCMFTEKGLNEEKVETAGDKFPDHSKVNLLK